MTIKFGKMIIRNKFIFFILSLGLVVNCSTCRKKSEKLYKIKPFYRNDINSVKDRGFEYPPKAMPVKNVTTEKELYKIFVVKPTNRRSFKRAIIRKIRNKTIKYDKLLLFMDLEREMIKKKLNGDRSVRGWNLKEGINLYIFIYKGVVQDFIVSHFEFKWNPSREKPGKYNEYAKGPRKESYPGGDQDLCFYWDEKYRKTEDDENPLGDCENDYPFKFERGD